MYPKILTIITPAFFASLFGFLMAPFLLDFLFKYRLWKRVAREEGNTDLMSEAFEKVHNAAAEKRTPRVGGIIVVLSLIVTTLFLVMMQTVAPHSLVGSFDFTSRNQTLIPIVVFVVMALIGLGSDLLQIFSKSKVYTQGYPRSLFLLLMLGFVIFGSYWFYIKLGMASILVPVIGNIFLGWLFIPFFIVAAYGVFSSGVIDGIDGLAGGVMAIIYVAYALIAYNQAQYDIAAYCFAVAGSILPFLWFNIPPARIYMGEVGMLALTSSLTFVAFLTRHIILLPIIAFPLFLTALSSFIQIVAKKAFDQKVFLIAPVHHHFEALGWSKEKVVMRYWIVTVLFALAGVLLAAL